MPLSHSQRNLVKLLIEFDPKPTLVVNKIAVAHLLAEMLQREINKSAFLSDYGIKVLVSETDEFAFTNHSADWFGDRAALRGIR